MVNRLISKLGRAATSSYQLTYLETGGRSTAFPFQGLPGTVAVSHRNNRVILRIRVAGQSVVHRPITLYRKALSQDLWGLYESREATALIGVIDTSRLQIEAPDPDAAAPIILRATRP
ncbi:hypothetical protein [Spirosoma pulveris]